MFSRHSSILVIGTMSFLFSLLKKCGEEGKESPGKQGTRYIDFENYFRLSKIIRRGNII